MIPAVSAATGGGTASLPYQWVAAGGSGALYTSTSTNLSGAWTSRTSSFSSTAINSVASNGTSLYVAVGDAGKLATSPDGITWTQRTSSFGAGDSIKEVAFGNGYWVAVGDNAKVAYSTDGTTWTQKTTGITGSVQCVEWGNGLWAIGNSTGSLYTATDPTGTWTSRTSTLGNVFDLHYFKAQSIWVAGVDTGTTGAFASSTDGITWTARTSADSISASGARFCSNNSVLAVTAFTAMLTTDFQYSTNGTSYTGSSGGDTYTAYACSDNLGLLVVPNAFTSTDGITWTSRTDPISPTSLTMCHSSGQPAIR